MKLQPSTKFLQWGNIRILGIFLDSIFDSLIAVVGFGVPLAISITRI